MEPRGRSRPSSLTPHGRAYRDARSLGGGLFTFFSGTVSRHSSLARPYVTKPPHGIIPRADTVSRCSKTEICPGMLDRVRAVAYLIVSYEPSTHEWRERKLCRAAD